MAGQVSEIATGTGTAGGIPSDADGLEVASPDVAGDEAAVEGGFAAGEELESFGYLERSDEVDDRTKDADGVAGFFEAVTVCGGFEEAGETRC